MRPKLKSIFTILNIVIALSFFSCKKESDNGGNDAATQKDISNVEYGNDTAEKMDVYLPAGRSINATKVIVMIHGGSWKDGDKGDFDEAITSIRSQLPDCAFFNINYRLASGGNNLYPAAINDVDAAINFIVSMANEYLVSANKIIIVGASAGAHLGLLEAYKNNANENIKAVIDLAGPTDLTWMYYHHPYPVVSQPILFNFLGFSAEANPAIYQEASPINYVTAQSPPTQIFHGDADPIVPVSESERLQQKLLSNNVKVELTIYAGEGHGWTGDNLIDTYTKAIAFIGANGN